MRKLLNLTLLALLLSVNVAQARRIYVSKSGSDQNSGVQESPYLTISKAAYHAIGGDTVLVSGGVYREWVSPANSGINDQMRVVYMAAQGEDVYLKGSEQITTWKKGKSGVWRVEIDNTLFGDFNPYAINVYGDWLHNGKSLHLGEVYIDNVALVEDISGENIAQTQGYWRASVNDSTTVIEANFGDKNPNKSLTEINVRPTCFYPKATGMNYITVDGLKISQAASQWAAPTSEQWGIIGPNWSKGWVIKSCDISHSKCVGISVGKERASGQNMASLYANNEKVPYNFPGFNREIEAILKAYDLGWSKENIGSHLIENNVIHNCGQAGIVGHLGGAFSTIRNNEIYDINCTDGRMTGFETAGIKLHAAIDTYIVNNVIVNTTRGLWLDWQAQGTHVCGNVFDKNESQDIFLEVSHGPTLIYNNIFFSDNSAMVDAQGVVFANNLFCGGVAPRTSSSRFTPYHFTHSTKVKGFCNNVGGDVHYYNNIFLGAEPQEEDDRYVFGLAKFGDYPTLAEIIETPIRNKFTGKMPIYCSGNIYFDYAKPSERHEADAASKSGVKVQAELVKRDGVYYIETNLTEGILDGVQTLPVNTAGLGWSMISQDLYEHRDGTPFTLEYDFYGKERDAAAPMVGPFETPNSLAVWPVEN